MVFIADVESVYIVMIVINVTGMSEYSFTPRHEDVIENTVVFLND